MSPKRRPENLLSADLRDADFVEWREAFWERDILELFLVSRQVALIGPRQCGKTTLAHQILPSKHENYFDLEDPVAAGLLENPIKSTPWNYLFDSISY